MNPVIIIPCFNDNKYIDTLLNSILSDHSIDILLVDDGSKEELMVNSTNERINIIRNSSNKGKGYSLKKGFKHACSRGYTHAVTLDADMQHDPKYIYDFINVDHSIDIVIGMRDFNQNMPVLRRFSNKTTSFIVSSIIGKKILDSQSGFRRYKLESQSFDKCKEDGFQFESEILINELKQVGSRVEHIPISTVYNDEKSSINNTADTYKFIKLILRKIFD